MPTSELEQEKSKMPVDGRFDDVPAFRVSGEAAQEEEDFARWLESQLTPGMKEWAELKNFDTGAVRSSDAEGYRYDLISPIALRRLAETCHEGAEKYNDFNWEKGMPIHDLLNHAVRHIYLYLWGDRSEDHLAHAMWGCGAAIHSEEEWPQLNTEEHLRPARKEE